MNHLFEAECHCSIFQTKNISLEILSIHKILTMIENFFIKYRNFDFLKEFFQDTKNFFFHVKVRMIHVSQHKNVKFVMECNLKILYFVLKNYCDLSKIVEISFEMLSFKKFSCLKFEITNVNGEEFL